MPKTYVVICEGIVWERDDSWETPGRILPDARERLAALMGTGRVILVSPVFNSTASHRRAWEALFYEDIPYTDLHTAPGFPAYDEVIYAPPGQ